MYNKILVPVDFSRESIKSVENSIKFLNNGGKITVFHVFPADLPSYLAFFQDMTFLGDASKIEASLIKIREKAEENLSQIVSEFSKKGVNIEAELVDGKPYIEIIKKSSDFDLVVLGLKEKDYGISVPPMKVIRKAESDVLIIKGEVNVNMEKVLFPIDIHDINPKIIERMKQFSFQKSSEIHVLSVIEMMPFEDVEYLGGRDILNLEAIKKRTIAVFKEHIGIENAKYVVSIAVDVADEIENFSKSEGIGLVVMAHRKMSGFERTILGSTSEKFVNITRTPTLIIK